MPQLSTHNNSEFRDGANCRYTYSPFSSAPTTTTTSSSSLHTTALSRPIDTPFEAEVRLQRGSSHSVQSSSVQEMRGVFRPISDEPQVQSGSLRGTPSSQSNEVPLQIFPHRRRREPAREVDRCSSSRNDSRLVPPPTASRTSSSTRHHSAVIATSAPVGDLAELRAQLDALLHEAATASAALTAPALPPPPASAEERLTAEQHTNAVEVGDLFNSPLPVAPSPPSVPDRQRSSLKEDPVLSGTAALHAGLRISRSAPHRVSTSSSTRKALGSFPTSLSEHDDGYPGAEGWGGIFSSTVGNTAHHLQPRYQAPSELPKSGGSKVARELQRARQTDEYHAQIEVLSQQIDERLECVFTAMRRVVILDATSRTALSLSMDTFHDLSLGGGPQRVERHRSALIAELEACEAAVVASVLRFVELTSRHALKWINEAQYSAALQVLLRADAVLHQDAGRLFRYLPEPVELRTERLQSPDTEVIAAVSPAASRSLSIPFFSPQREPERLKAAAAIEHNLGIYHFKLGEYRLAQERFARAARIEEQLQESNIGITYFNMAQTEHELHNMTEALHYMELAEEAVERRAFSLKDAAVRRRRQLEDQHHRYAADSLSLTPAHINLEGNRSQSTSIDDISQDTKHEALNLQWREAVCFLSVVTETHAGWLFDLGLYRPSIQRYHQAFDELSSLPHLAPEEHRRQAAIKEKWGAAKKRLRREEVELELYHHPISPALSIAADRCRSQKRGGVVNRLRSRVVTSVLSRHAVRSAVATAAGTPEIRRPSGRSPSCRRPKHPSTSTGGLNACVTSPVPPTTPNGLRRPQQHRRPSSASASIYAAYRSRKAGSGAAVVRRDPSHTSALTEPSPPGLTFQGNSLHPRAAWSSSTGAPLLKAEQLPPRRAPEIHPPAAAVPERALSFSETSSVVISATAAAATTAADSPEVALQSHEHNSPAGGTPAASEGAVAGQTASVPLTSSFLQERLQRVREEISVQQIGAGPPRIARGAFDPAADLAPVVESFSAPPPPLSFTAGNTGGTAQHSSRWISFADGALPPRVPRDFTWCANVLLAFLRARLPRGPARISYLLSSHVSVDVQFGTLPGIDAGALQKSSAAEDTALIEGVAAAADPTFTPMGPSDSGAREEDGSRMASEATRMAEMEATPLPLHRRPLDLQETMTHSGTSVSRSIPETSCLDESLASSPPLHHIALATVTEFSEAVRLHSSHSTSAVNASLLSSDEQRTSFNLHIHTAADGQNDVRDAMDHEDADEVAPGGSEDDGKASVEVTAATAGIVAVSPLTSCMASPTTELLCDASMKVALPDENAQNSPVGCPYDTSIDSQDGSTANALPRTRDGSLGDTQLPPIETEKAPHTIAPVTSVEADDQMSDRGSREMGCRAGEEDHDTITNFSIRLLDVDVEEAVPVLPTASSCNEDSCAEKLSAAPVSSSESTVIPEGPIAFGEVDGDVAPVPLTPPGDAVALPLLVEACATVEVGSIGEVFLCGVPADVPDQIFTSKIFENEEVNMETSEKSFGVGIDEVEEMGVAPTTEERVAESRDDTEDKFSTLPRCDKLLEADAKNISSSSSSTPQLLCPPAPEESAAVLHSIQRPCSSFAVTESCHSQSTSRAPPHRRRIYVFATAEVCDEVSSDALLSTPSKLRETETSSLQHQEENLEGQPQEEAPLAEISNFVEVEENSVRDNGWDAGDDAVAKCQTPIRTPSPVSRHLAAISIAEPTLLTEIAAVSSGTPWTTDIMQLISTEGAETLPLEPVQQVRRALLTGASTAAQNSFPLFPSAPALTLPLHCMELGGEGRPDGSQDEENSPAKPIWSEANVVSSQMASHSVLNELEDEITEYSFLRQQILKEEAAMVIQQQWRVHMERRGQLNCDEE